MTTATVAHITRVGTRYNIIAGTPEANGNIPVTRTVPGRKNHGISLGYIRPDLTVGLYRGPGEPIDFTDFPRKFASVEEAAAAIGSATEDTIRTTGGVMMALANA